MNTNHIWVLLKLWYDASQTWIHQSSALFHSFIALASIQDFKNSFQKGFFFKKIVFEKLFFKFYCICLLLEKLINRKYFPVNEKYFSVKEKFDLVFRKVFSFYFERKTFSGSYKKFRNVILFADYIKFGSQIFDCYIYFVLNICFSISFLRI